MTPYQKLKGSEKRPFCWVVGSGTSLDNIDITKIHGDPIFALNAAVILCLSANPLNNINTNWVFSNKRPWKENKDRLIEKPYRIYTRIENVGTTKGLGESGIPVVGLDESLGEGASKHTVATRAVRIARHLGYRNVFLLGIDCAPNEEGEVYAKPLRYAFALYGPKEKQPTYFNNFIKDWKILKGEITDMGIYTCSPLLDKSLFKYISFETALELRDIL
jgi:hypothetical protein